MRARVLVAATWAAASACATLPASPDVRPGGSPPRVDPIPVALEDPPIPVERPRPAGDPIVDSPWILEPAFTAEVERWMEGWSGPRSGEFEEGMRRMGAWGALVEEALARRGLPTSLRYLPLIESSYTATAVSRASAVGLWQLVAPTARAGGLRVGALVDERRDPVRATETAVAYLEELHGRFGSWFLALAAYNAGPTRVEGLLERYADGRRGSDGLFWTIRPYLPSETRHFVPRFVAAARLAGDPRAHGLDASRPAPAETWDEVVVPDATSLDVVADAAGVSELEVRRLNPQLLRSVTPAGVAIALRLPPGTGPRFTEVYAMIPEAERVSLREHRVEPGETLWGIARRYGVALAALEEANPGARPERLRPGDRLIVPLVPGRRSGVGGR